MSAPHASTTSPPDLSALPAVASLYRAAIGPLGADYYAAVFDRFETAGRSRPSWNWAAALLTLNWLLFRRLWLAALAWVSDVLMQRLHAAAGLDAKPTDAPGSTTPPDALAALQAVFLAHVDFVVAHPGVPRVIFQELQQPQDTPLKASVRQLMQQYRALLMRLLIRAKEDNLIAPSADLTGASVLFIGSIQGLVMQSLISGDGSAMRQQAPAVFALVQRGLQATATHSTQGKP